MDRYHFRPVEYEAWYHQVVAPQLREVVYSHAEI